MTLVTAINGNLKLTYAKGAGGTNALYEPLIELIDSLATGTGINQADKLYAAEDVALGGSGTANFDLAGSLTDAFGDALTFVKLKVLYFHNKSTTAGNTVTVGNGANPLLIFDAGPDTKTVGPDGRLLIWEPSLAGITVTAGTGDNLLITNDTANAITYDILFAGTSA